MPVPLSLEGVDQSPKNRPWAQEIELDLYGASEGSLTPGDRKLIIMCEINQEISIFVTDDTGEHRHYKLRRVT